LRTKSTMVNMGSKRTFDHPPEVISCLFQPAGYFPVNLLAWSERVWRIR